MNSELSPTKLAVDIATELHHEFGGYGMHSISHAAIKAKAKIVQEHLNPLQSSHAELVEALNKMRYWAEIITIPGEKYDQWRSDMNTAEKALANAATLGNSPSSPP